jgi:Hydrazine synthase alpha subunit middle domain
MNCVVGQQIRFVSIQKALFLFAFLLLAEALWAQVKTAQTIAPAPSKNLSDILFVQAPATPGDLLSDRFPQGSRILLLPAKQQRPSTPINLTVNFFAAADPEVSFDATKILFSAKKSAGDPWQIWEMNADGSSQRQVTQCPHDCQRAAYLPGDEIVLTYSERLGSETLLNLAVTKLNGESFHPITFGRANFWLETVLRDGRVLATASWPPSAHPAVATSRTLYTLRPDGAALDSLRCDHQHPATRREAAELTDGTIIFVAPAYSRHSKITDVPTRLALTEIRPASLREAPVKATLGIYQFPAQLSPDTLILSYSQWSAKGVAVPQPALYTFNRKTNSLGPRIYHDPHFANVQAVPVLAHAIPKKFWSILNLDSKTGSFISLNSASSADEPSGHIAAAISRVRVFALDESSGQSEHALGEAPVEKDGSFFVEVPANQPVRFELLDAKGQVLRAEHSYIWARPGEQRGCAGCHSSKAVAPENRWPLTLKRFDTPTALISQSSTQERASASAQAPVN